MNAHKTVVWVTVDDDRDRDATDELEAAAIEVDPTAAEVEGI